jgi:hypothetical protein
MILIPRNKVCHICMKDGPYIRGMSPSKVDESKRFISLAKDHQKVEHRASYQLGIPSELTNEPVFPI